MQVSVSYKDIIRLTLPLSLAMVVPQVSFFTNTAFTGRLGEEALAVNGVAGIFFLILAMIGYGLSSGIQVMLSRRAGEGDAAGIAAHFTSAAVLTLGCSVALVALSLLLAPLVFSHGLHHARHAALATDFLMARVWGLPFLMATQLANSLAIATGKARFIIAGSAAATVLNILFDWLLIFGHHGFPHMGLQGAAVASVIAEIGGCAVMYTLGAAFGLFSGYPLRRYLRPDWPLIRNMFLVALPLIVQYFFSIAGWQIFFIYVEHLGESELAASQILRSVFGIFGISTWAFAATSNMMVSNIIGQGRTEEVPALIGRIAAISIGVTLVLCGALLLGARPFLALYRDDAALLALALPSLRIIGLAAIIMSVATVVFNGVAGTGRTVVNLCIEITCVVTYLIYCTIAIEHLRAGLAWAWMSEFVYWSMLLLISWLYLQSGKWKGKMV